MFVPLAIKTLPVMIKLTDLGGKCATACMDLSAMEGLIAKV